MGTKILNSRWFYVVLSILLAFLLWVYVGNDPNSVDTGTLRNVRVVFSGLEKLEERGLMISEGAEQTVNLQLSARGEVWSRLNQGDTTVVVDVSGITDRDISRISKKLLVSERWIRHILCKYHLFFVIIDQYYPEEEWKDEETEV